jgi:hypothetical protein
MHELTNSVSETPRWLSNIPKLAIQKASFWGSFLKRVREELFLEKVPPSKKPLPQKRP